MAVEMVRQFDPMMGWCEGPKVVVAERKVIKDPISPAWALDEDGALIRTGVHTARVAGMVLTTPVAPTQPMVSPTHVAR